MADTPWWRQVVQQHQLAFASSNFAYQVFGWASRLVRKG
jgi:hypothetical protein